eukprot:5320389-Pyramimonas_sp.AAC.1
MEFGIRLGRCDMASRSVALACCVTSSPALAPSKPGSPESARPRGSTFASMTSLLPCGPTW